MKRVLCALIMCCSPLAAFQGFYVGGGIGGHLAESTQAGNSLGVIDEIISAPADLQQEMFDHGVAGMLYAGYGLGWRSLNLAVEGFVQFGSAQLHSKQENVNESDSTPDLFHVPTETTARIRCCQVGIDLLPGWSPNPAALLYGRVGVSAGWSALDVSSTNMGQDTGAVVWNLPLALSKKRCVAAFRVGGGIEQRLSQRWALRADYIYTDYGRLSVQGASSGTDSTGTFPVTVSNNTEVHLYDHAVMLGLCYRFCCLTPLCPDLCCMARDYQGFYLGGSIGGGALETKQRGGALGNDPAASNLIQVANAPSQLYNNQFQGMIFLGYGRTLRRLYLGGELFAQAASHTSMKATGQALLTEELIGIIFSTSYETTVKSSTWQFGFDMRPGALLTPYTLLYGRVGVAAAEMKAHSAALFTANNPIVPISLSLPEGVSTSTWKPTFRLGVGIEHLLASNLHLRADYIFTNYGILSFNDTATGHDSLGNTITLNNTLTSHLQNNAIVVGLSYYFH